MRPALFGKILMLLPMAALVLVGCGGGSATDLIASESLFLSVDPLDGSLNSTMDETPADPQTRIDMLAEVLGLDEIQKQALEDAYTTLRTGVDALKAQVESGDLSVDAAHEQAASLRDAFEADLQVILTPEQYDQLQQMREDRHGRGRGHRNPQDRWTAWLDEVGADADQLTAVLDALAALRADAQELHGRVRDGDLTREEARSELEDLRAAFDANLQTILTAEQYAALQALRPDRG